MKQISLIIATLMMSALIFSGCSNTSEDTSDANDSISVATTIFPLYTIAKQITGDKINVELMLVPGDGEGCGLGVGLGAIGLGASGFGVVVGVLRIST